MARWVIFPITFLVLVVLLLLGTHTNTLAQSTSTPAPFVQSGEATAQAATVMPGVEQAPGITSPARAALVLTLQDTGRTFTIPVNTLIFLQIPRAPFFRLIYDPSILQEIEVQPLPMQPVQPDGVSPTEVPQILPAAGWRLIAIRAGVTSLSLEQQPCRMPPCPMMPIFNFRVTIVVDGSIGPLPPQPPVVRSDIYIGTAYLNQTIVAQVGQVVTLELPFLSPGRQVHLQFNPGVLRPLPGQDLNYPQPGGWHFVVAGPGTTPLIVQGDACIDGSLDCQPTVLFQVTITTSAPGSNP